MARHPAQFSTPILDTIAALLVVYVNPGSTVLDPFAGVGGIHALSDYRTVGVELEPEWAAAHPDTICGDSTDLSCMFDPESVDAIVTSPAYGNRMADNYAGDANGSRRFTYRIALGRALSPWNGAGLQWGTEYRNLHETVWAECHTVLKPGGMLIVNVSNHIRKGIEQPVVEWHLSTLIDLGFRLEEARPVRTMRMRYGQNGERRVSTEKVLALSKP
jgi:DNA modification methylase